jgi:hypothetical protein
MALSVEAQVGEDRSKVFSFLDTIFDGAFFVSYISEDMQEPCANLFINELRELCTSVPKLVSSRSWLPFEHLLV